MLPIMDYQNAAFRLGTNDDIELGPPGNQTPPRTSPAREPIPPAKPGFTRSAGEDDICVCPNCDEELCTGEDEVKRQIFVVKACGHVSGIPPFFYHAREEVLAKTITQVYCGECARNRQKSKRNGKAPAHTLKVPPFDKCKVPDCGKSVKSSTSMIQIFL